MYLSIAERARCRCMGADDGAVVGKPVVASLCFTDLGLVAQRKKHPYDTTFNLSLNVLRGWVDLRVFVGEP